MKLFEIALAIGEEVTGDRNIEISGVSPLVDAGREDISFVRDKKAEKILPNSGAGAVIMQEGSAPDRPAIITKHPTLAFAKVLEIFSEEKALAPGIHPSAVIGENVSIGKNVSVGAHAVVGEGTILGDNVVLGAGVKLGHDCQIGPSTLICENSVLYRKTSLGARCRVHANTVIGSDGFGYTLTDDGTHYKVPQTGVVAIEDDVELGAGVTVDRATMGATIIKNGAKIDNQTQIGHNSIIGKNVIIAGCTAIAGSVKIADGVMIGGMVAIAENITIGKGVMIAGKSGVISDILEPGVYSGVYATKNMEHKRFLLSGKRIDKLEKKIRELKKRIGE